MIVVSDTGPIRYLVAIGRERIIPFLFDGILIPPAVLAELLHPHAPNPVRAFARELPPWVELRTPGIPPIRIDADLGEAEAIALALETRKSLLTDDRLAARIARHAGIETFGTLGLLQQAHARSLDEITDALLALGKTNFRHTTTLFDRVVKEAERMRRERVP